MRPFHFGSSRRPLFGVYHAPTRGPAGREGVVLCQPHGREYLHAHRAFRRLAETLSGAGLHVLRFDYTGCGDSAGRGDEVSLERWTEDVGTAVEELRATGGVRRIGLVGLRLGATVAILAARERSDVRSLVLWEPVLDGTAYLRALREGHEAALRSRHPPIHDGMETGDDEALGFALPDRFREELASIDLSEAASPGAADPVDGLERGGLIVSHLDDDLRGLVERWRDGGVDVEVREIPTSGSWADIDEVGQALLPREALTAAAELAGRAA